MAKQVYQLGGERVIPAIRVPDIVYDELKQRATDESKKSGKRVPMAVIVRQILIDALGLKAKLKERQEP